MDKQILLVCECADLEHQVVFRQIGSIEHREVYVSILLSKMSFRYRLKYGLQYIFGKQSRYGAFNEIITTKANLQNVVDNLE